LIHGVNFNNILQAAFAHADPKAQKDKQLGCIFALLESVSAKAARRTLMKLTHGGNFF